MVQYTSPRICIDCKLPKDLSEFYPRGGGYLCSYCKDCMRLRSKHQKPIDRKISTVQSENEVIAQLHLNGVPALPGKALHQQWADVIAWGCVLIEVKSAAYIDRQFNFGFSYSQRNGKLRGDLIALVCRYEDGNTYHVFPSNHPMFYGSNGKLKSTVTWTPNRGNQGRHSIVTDELMKAAENQWQMVEDYRQRIAARLVRVQELPILLNAA